MSMWSVRRRRNESASSLRIRAGLAFLTGAPPRFHSRPTLVASTTWSRRPQRSTALPTISSDRPWPYAGAVSISVMPRSSAEQMVRIDRSSSVPPHIQPPIAHVPRPMRETFCVMPSISTYSMTHSVRLAGSLDGRIDQVLGDEPDVHLVGADDAAHEQVVGAVVTCLGCAAREGARLAQHELVGAQQPRQLDRHVLAAARCARDAGRFRDVLRHRDADAAE